MPHPEDFRRKPNGLSQAEESVKTAVSSPEERAEHSAAWLSEEPAKNPAAGTDDAPYFSQEADSPYRSEPGKSAVRPGRDWRSLVVTGGFLLVIGGLTIANWCTPDRAFSETENRPLQAFPTLTMDAVLSGRFTSQYETWANDQFVGRDGWVGLKTLSQLALVRRDNGRVYFGQDGYLFEKVNGYDESRVRKNTAAVGDFLARARQANPELTTTVVLAPTAAAILPEKLPAFAPVPDQGAVIDQMKRAAAGAQVLDITAALTARKDAAPLYYRTDHHWTTAGAYAAYTAIAPALGISPLPETAFEKQTVSHTFRGTLYAKANLFTLEPDSIEIWNPRQANPCTVTWAEKELAGLYDPAYLSTRDQYAYFLGGNHSRTTVTTAVTNGKTLVLVKDSYANAVVPFLAQHYERIVLVDPRYDKEPLGELLTQDGVTDLLVLYNVQGFAAETSIAAELSKDF